MDPLTIALISGGLSLGGKVLGGIFGGSVGNKQMKEGQSQIAAAGQIRKNTPRPTMAVPEAIKRMVEMSRGQMFQSLPGYQNYQNQIGATTAEALGAINKSSAGAEGIGAIADVYGNKLNAEGGLATQNAAFQQQGQQGYMSALSGLGDWQQQAWQWNKADPYLSAMERASQLDQAGRMNQFHGYKTKAGVWANMFSGGGDALGDMAGDILPLLTK